METKSVKEKSRKEREPSSSARSSLCSSFGLRNLTSSPPSSPITQGYGCASLRPRVRGSSSSYGDERRRGENKSVSKSNPKSTAHYGALQRR